MIFLTLMPKAENYDLNKNDLEIVSFNGFKKEFRSSKTNFRCHIQKKAGILFLTLPATQLDIFWVKKTPCHGVEVNNDFSDCFYKKMLGLKESLVFDLRINTSERQCLEINEQLICKKKIPRVWKLKKKFRYLFNTDSEKDKMKRNLSTCIIDMKFLELCKKVSWEQILGQSDLFTRL